MNTAEVAAIVEEVVKLWQDKEGNLIMVLHQIQNKFSYVPREVSFEVAHRLRVPLARIYEVITFYNYFKLEAPGKHVVSVCLGTACYLKGAKSLISELKNELGIDPGQTTPDKNFHVQVVRCLGCCGLSPVMTVGHKVHPRLTADKVHGILEEHTHEDRPVAERSAR